ncbi:MAG: dihydropteroate synthase [Bacteroidaceae bacterium]|jgi:dihydropteroate synthase|nr:dihydropteroate synthase [Bacteroidaceae bacterium]
MAKIMGIINVTPDSFWSGSRVQDKSTLVERVRMMISQGADAIDVGGCSTRPGAVQASEKEEMERLEWGLEAIREEFPDVLLSVDTYRPRIAERCIRDWKVDIINDVYGGNDDMYKVLADTGVQYVLMWSEDIRKDPIGEMMEFFRYRLQLLEKAGVDVNRKVILDPGYGFGKTVEQNYTVLANQSRLCEFGLPVLSALSRKSMAWKLLKITPDDALPATIALNTVAIEQGAEWIRVHDVQEAVHTNLIVQALRDNK